MIQLRRQSKQCFSCAEHYIFFCSQNGMLDSRSILFCVFLLNLRKNEEVTSEVCIGTVLCLAYIYYLLFKQERKSLMNNTSIKHIVILTKPSDCQLNIIDSKCLSPRVTVVIFQQSTSTGCFYKPKFKGPCHEILDPYILA